MTSASARLYETDFYGWIQQQANDLKAGSFASLDLENLIEEIESMGKSHQRAYSYAVMGACAETGFKEETFPAHCPWTFEQVIDPGFWPE